MEKKFTKLSALVDSEFTIEKVWGFKWKAWDPETSKMLVSDTYEKGYRKMYSVDTDKGSMDVSAGQLSNMLEGVSQEGKADIVGRTFHVKSNGQTGMDIRYYINPVFKKKEDTVVKDEEVTEDFDYSQIPF